MEIVSNHYQVIDFTQKGSKYTLEILSGGFARLHKGTKVLGVKSVASRDEALLWAGARVEQALDITCVDEHSRYAVRINGEPVYTGSSMPLRDEFYERIQLHVKGEEPPKLMSEQLKVLDELVKDKVERVVG